MKEVKNLKQIEDLIVSSPMLQQRFKEQPQNFLTNNFKLVPDTRVYRYTVIFLGLTVLFVIIGYFTMPLTGLKQLDSAVIALASAAVGALAGMVLSTK
ncbi:MAG: hypothetical protein RJQ09_12990 [Cyclobacteriaceae bacterium]